MIFFLGMRLVRGPKLNMYSEMPFSDIEVLEFVLKDMVNNIMVFAWFIGLLNIIIKGF